jgi:hypothetical protein
VIDDHRVDVAVVRRVIKSNGKLRIDTLKSRTVVRTSERINVRTDERYAPGSGQCNAVGSGERNTVRSCERNAGWTYLVENDSGWSNARNRIGTRQSDTVSTRECYAVGSG